MESNGSFPALAWLGIVIATTAIYPWAALAVALMWLALEVWE